MKPLKELYSLKDKIAVITGGAVNIGRAITLRLAEAGADVAVVFYHSTDEADSLAGELEKFGGRTKMIRADISDEKQVVDIFNRVEEEFGGVDILVNNAGIFGLSMQENLKVPDWDKVFDLNVKGLFMCSREATKKMKVKSTGGVMVNIASINALHPGFGQTAHYDASKGAVEAYTRSLAAEVAGYGIRVNAVAPGLVGSEMLRLQAAELALAVEKRTPLKKLASHEDVANAVLFLCTPASSHITGETLIVDGGYLLS